MMHDDANHIKAYAAYYERLQGFLDDGYHETVRYTDDKLLLSKLRHHNGNRIMLKLSLDDGELSQHTNNVKVFCQKMY